MAKVKKTIVINGRGYKMPAWNFRDIRKLESCGFGIMELQNPEKNIFTALSAFVAVAANIEPEDADEMIEGHIENGGDIRELLNDFYASLGESSFFKKWIETMNKKTPKGTEVPEVAD